MVIAKAVRRIRDLSVAAGISTARAERASGRVGKSSRGSPATRNSDRSQRIRVQASFSSVMRTSASGKERTIS